MKKKHYFQRLALLLAAAVILPACSARQVEGTSQEGAPEESTPPVTQGQEENEQPKPEEGTSPEGAPEESTLPVTQGQEEESSETAVSEGVLYIGTRDRGFDQYPITYEGEITPEVLIAEIGNLTGWDMTLAEEVTVGKGGMSVCFAASSALFVGPPDPQKEEFFVFDAEQLSQTILDSVQKTLQMAFVGEGGDPDTLNIYYYMEGDKPLELPAIGKTWTIDQPYVW